MMDDFIRPPKKEVKQETKQRPIKEVLIVDTISSSVISAIA